MPSITSVHSLPASLAIGPLNFSLHAAPGVVLDAWPAGYAEFLAGSSVEPQAQLHVPVRVERGLPAGLATRVPAFEADRAWSLLREPGRRVLVHAPHGLAQAQWAATLPDAQTDVIVGVAPDPAAPAAALRCPLQYPLDQILVMYRSALEGRGLLVHAAGLVMNDRLYVFAGRSGAGKSTLSRLLASAGLGALLSDDRLLLWQHADGPVVGYGTPWPGTERIARQGGAPLAALIFLEHGRDNTFRPLSPRAALEALLPLLSILWHEPELAARQLDLAGALLAAVPAYRWPFTPDPDALRALTMMNFRP